MGLSVSTGVNKAESEGKRNGWGVSEFDQKELVNIETEMHDLHVATEGTIRDAFLKFGEMLCEARTLIDDDTVFGDWRKECTPFESKQSANSAMLCHRAIGEGVITPKMLESKMGQSHLVEIQNSTLIVQSEIETLLASGKTPTIKDIRELKKGAESNADKVAGIRAENNKDKDTGTDVSTGTYKDGYEKGEEKVIPSDTIEVDEEKDAIVKNRDPKDLFLDEVNEFEAIIGEAMDSTLLMHKHAEAMHSHDDKKRVNEMRALLKQVQELAGESYKANEE